MDGIYVSALIALLGTLIGLLIVYLTPEDDRRGKEKASRHISHP
jgi:hypothetical protein